MLYSVWYFLYTRFFFSWKHLRRIGIKLNKVFFRMWFTRRGFEFGDNYTENVTRWYSVVRSGALSKPYSRKNIDLLWSETLLQSRPFARKWSEAETSYSVRIGRPVTWMRQNKIAIFFPCFLSHCLCTGMPMMFFLFLLLFEFFPFCMIFFFYAVWVKTRLS